MPRFKRLVVPGYPHHVTQRGSRRQRTFFDDADYTAYHDQLAEQLPKADAELLAYCLMPNHVHLIVIPHRLDSLARLLRKTHSRYARRTNLKYDWQGHLWQKRFHSFVMDEEHLRAAARYVELNPVRAGLCQRADEWPWSSVHFHLHECADRLITAGGMRAHIDNWRAYLDEELTTTELDTLRRHSRNGHPAGCLRFIAELESLTGRTLVPRKRGPKPARDSHGT